MKRTSAYGETVRLARKRTITNAWKLLQTAVELFEQENYPHSCFLAMTAIEEVGKLILLSLIQTVEILEPAAAINSKPFNKSIRDHIKKSILAAAHSLYINAGADRRHGIHPISRMHRTSGVILLARSNQWMNIRNSCLYIDVNLDSKSVFSPDIISREYAYYFICMGFEVIAENAEAGFGSVLEEDNFIVSSQNIFHEYGEFLSSPQWSNIYYFDGSCQKLRNDVLDRFVSELIELTKRQLSTLRPVPEDSNLAKSHMFLKDRLGDLDIFMKRWSGTVDIDKLDFLAYPERFREKAEKCDINRNKKREKV